MIHQKKEALLRFCAPMLLAMAGLPAQAQNAARLFDDRQVQEVRLEVDPVAWATLRRDFQLDTYYPAQFTWNGQTVENVGIRSRGTGSRSGEKPNLRVSFDRFVDDQEFLGLESVILKANNQDASLIRELVAMQFYRRMGLPGPREAPARLFVNGEFFGAYTLVEEVDESFLRRNYSEDGGYLYDWEEVRTTTGYHFEYLGPDPASYSPRIWDPSNHSRDPDPITIEAMVRAINQSSDADFVAAVSQYVDLKQFMTYIAIEEYIADWDGILGDVFGMNNVQFYRLEGTTQFQIVPWDKDLSMDWAERSITKGVEENVLARRAMQVPELRNAFLEALNKAAELAGGAGGWMDQEVDRYYALIGDMARQEPHKQCSTDAGMVTCGAAEFEHWVGVLRQFVRNRAAFVIREVAAAGFQPPAATLRILSVGSAASNAAPGLAPGALISIFGEGLSQSTDQASRMPPPATLANVVVSINGARAPLLFVSPGQLNAQVPWDTTPGPGSITVFVNGAPANTVAADIGDFAPGIFVVAHGASGDPVTAERPAAAGETLVIYATGLGSGNDIPDVSLNGAPASVELAQLSPDVVGLHQVRIQLPPDSPAGTAVPLSMTIGGQTATIPLPVIAAMAAQ